MEVHPPEHPIFTWKQFFIHMATICLGLLIALGLDQTVEYLHHRHQGHQFEEDMRTEAERNLELIARDHKVLARQADYYQSCRAALASAKPEGNKWRVLLPATPPTTTMRFALPSIAVWSTGKESQMVPFIPAPRARLFDRLTYEIDLLSVLRAQYIDLSSQYDDELAMAAGPSVSLKALGDVHDFLLTIEQRDRLDRIWTQLAVTARASDARLSGFEEVTRAVADGTPSLEAEQNASLTGAPVPKQGTEVPH